MTINQINGNNYRHKKTGESRSASPANQSNSGSETSKGQAADNTKRAANLSLSGSTFKNDVHFSKLVLSNSRKKSLDSLKDIKKKINAGAYESREVQKKIGSLLKNDLGSLNHIFHATADSTNPSEPGAIDQKKELLQNPDVYKKIARSILGDLSNIS